ncbi:MAG TPA: PIG-L family deacetylase, partial [Acidimicrobiales bacterium]|nr:PIG-L family deacetylase [Acidimicrobiales bacterium]
WLLSLGPVHDEGRLVFLVFDGEAPRYAVKCDRRAGPWPEAPSTGAAFLAEAVAASPLVASHVPRPVGSTRLDDRLLEVETAGVGFLLTTFLRGPFARDDKLVAIEAVAAWLLELAECSARPVDAEAEDATEELADIPRVLCHGDLWSSNVIIDTDGRFQVVDWADVQPLGLPLGDLLVFLSESLSELDGEDTDEGRDQHFVELLTGHHRSSPLLFVWVRAMVEALRIDPARVGAVAEAALVRMAEHRLGLAGLAPEQLYRDPRVLVGDPVVRRARLWTTTPGLGRDWQAWRVPASGPSGPSEPTEPLAGTKGGLRRMARRGERRVGHSARSLVDLIGRDRSDELGQGRVLVLAPHPDDETLACGGVLACHADSDSAFVIVASDGSHGAYGVDPQVLAARRRQELVAATVTLGLTSDRVAWWGYEDGTLRWRVDEIVARLEEAFDQLEPAFVLSPWALDVHPDHAALGRAARIAAADRPLELLEYVVWAWDRPSALVRAGSGSTSHEPAHGGRWLPAGRPVVFKDAHAREAKRTALSCYGSQIGGLGSGTARGEASLDRAMVELFVSGNELFWPAPRQPRHAGRGWPG